MTIKQQISKFIKYLRCVGLAFDAPKYSSSRILKINHLLDDISFPIGVCNSPYLKRNIRIKMYIYQNHIEIKDGVKVLIKIDDYLNNFQHSADLIRIVYEKYFYTLDEIEKVFSFRDDYDKVLKICKSFYPDLKLRNYGLVESELHLFFGSSTITYDVITSDTTQKLCSVKIKSYNKGSGKYQENNYITRYSYSGVLKGLNKPVNNFNFTKHIKAYQYIQSLL